MIWNIKQQKNGIYSVVQCIQFIIRIFGFWLSISEINGTVLEELNRFSEQC